MTDLLDRTIAAIGPLDADAMRAAEARQLQLTKPPKALGRLETLSIQLAGIQGKEQPAIATRRSPSWPPIMASPRRASAPFPLR